MDLYSKYPKARLFPHSNPLLQCFLKPKHHLGHSLRSRGDCKEGAGLGDAESGRVAARQASKAQKLRLSRASESWLISRQYGSRCRMKSTLWS